jgi:hypothetical protein
MDILPPDYESQIILEPNEYLEQEYIEHRSHNYLPQKLIISQIDFTRIEQKMYEMFVNQINYDKIDREKGLMVKIPIAFVKQYMTVEQIRDTTDKMSQKKITLYDVNHPELEFRHLPIFSEISYNHKQSGYLVFKSNPEISEYLILGNKYAKYDFITILNFKHTYSTLLYKLLRSQIGQNRYYFIYSIEELRKLLNVPVGTYQNLKDFKRKVLNTAMEEINNTPRSPIKFEYKHYGNKQRNVTHLEFTISTIFDTVTADKADFVEAIHVNPKLVYENVHELLLKHYNLKEKQRAEILSRKELIDKFVTLHIEFENGMYPKVKNKTAYILTCLGLVTKK